MSGPPEPAASVVFSFDLKSPPIFAHRFESREFLFNRLNQLIVQASVPVPECKRFRFSVEAFPVQPLMIITRISNPKLTILRVFTIVSLLTWWSR